MKKTESIIVSVLLIIIVSAAAWYLYNNSVKKDGNPWEILPVNPSFVVEINNPAKTLSKLNDNPVWESLNNTLLFKRVSLRIIQLDSLLKENKTVLENIKTNDLLISFYNDSANGLSTLFLAKMLKNPSAGYITHYLQNYLGNDYGVISTSMGKYNLYTVIDIPHDMKYFFSIIDGVLVFSMNENIVQKTINGYSANKNKTGNNEIVNKLRKRGLEVSEESTHAWSAEEEAADLEEFVKNGKIKIYSIDELKELVEKYKHTIVSENGVYTIKEELFKPETKKQTEKITKGAEEEISDNSGMLSIGDLFEDRENEDLLKDVGGHEEQKSETFVNRAQKIKILPLTDRGINWDEYLKYFNKPFSDVTKVKALVEVSRTVQAVSCAIMIKDDDFFIPDITIGLSDNSQKIFKIGQKDPFGQMFVKEGTTVICNAELKSVKYFSSKFSDEDKPYFKRAVFFPIVYKSASALLFFSFSKDSILEIKELIGRFNIV